MEPGTKPFSHLVVVGASAGGVESLSVLLGSIPATFPAPILIAQHLSPSRRSSLREILERRSPLEVVLLEDTAELKPGTVYVVPPNHNIAVTDHEASVFVDGEGPNPSIDLLFTSAARVFGENLIAVVLSGTGSDGAMGARDVKYAGGTVVIQDPETAAYPGMPLSLAPSVVDIVASRENIGEILGSLINGQALLPPPTRDPHLRSLLEELREQSGIDFTSYKEPTIQRRLQRRMLAVGQRTTEDYARYVADHPEERVRLVTSFLVKVTEFFRDPELYSYIEDQVMPELVRRARERETDLRIWSAGCSTGEEAYSLAMVVWDVLQKQGIDLNVRLFATDLDEHAVAFARRGIYPARALESISPERRERYFVPHGEDFEIRRELRNVVVFGEHDLAQRAPFPRIDLVFCRNVLIYFSPALQRRALQLFAFSLRSGGYLVLGKSESVGPLADYFTSDQLRLKVFRRVGARAEIPTHRTYDALLPVTTASYRPPGSSPSTGGAFPARNPGSGRTVGIHGESVLLALPIGVAIVDHNYDVQFINAEARRLLGVHTTALKKDLIHQVRHFDPVAMREIIDQAISTGNTETRVLSAVDSTPETTRSAEVSASVVPITGERDERRIVVSIIDVSERERLRQEQDAAGTIIERMTRANEDVLVANQELTQIVAHLRAENEELLITGEETQAATEEVETLNEELQASNEELETLNEELQATMEELNTTNEDLQNRSVELHATIEDLHTANAGLQSNELDLREMGEATNASQQRLRTVLDSLDLPIAVVGADGEVLVENQAYTDLCGEIKDASFVLDALGAPFAGDAHPFRRASRAETFREVVSCSGDDGTTRYMLNARPRATESGEPLGIVTFEPLPDEGADD
jgi:two-component system CheB/CheR fusion protein